MNTLRYFRELDGDQARADHFEGITHIFQPKDVIMKFSVPGLGEIVVDSRDLAAPTTLSRNSEHSCNLFCMHAITNPINGTLFPAEYEWFGDSIVLIHNTQEFLNRVLAACKAKNLSMKGSLIEYYDEEAYTGKLNRFKKPKQFAHQREFRIAVDSPGTEPLLLNIGDITDITSEILAFSDACMKLTFSEDEARAANLSW